MSSPEQPTTPDLANLEFRQLVAFAELQEVKTSGDDSAEIPRAFPELADLEVRDVVMNGSHGDVAGRIYQGTVVEGPGLVWVHGGAFLGGDLDMLEAHWVALALASRGFPVLSLDYHKALHGVHYPVPSDDVLTGWLWATGHADQLGVGADALHLGGASAGGNLVAGVTKRLRDGAGPLPSSVVLAYPIVHPEIPTLSAELEQKLAAEPRTPLASASIVRDMNLHYAGSEAALADPYAFAANGELAHQPPVLILNSETDLLRASGEAYGEDLRQAGVEVTVETEPGTRHGHLNGPEEPGALASIDRLATWLREHRHPG